MDLWKYFKYYIKNTDSSDTRQYGEGETKDIIKCLIKEFPKACEETSDFCKNCYQENTNFFLENLYQTICNHVKLKYDPEGKQIIRLPDNIVDEQIADCKSYSLFIASILYNCMIPFKMRFVSFTNSKDVTHVFIIAKGNIVMDCNLKEFNKEVTGYNYFEDYIFTK